MKPATTLLTIAAMAFVAQAAPVPLPNTNSLAIEMPKFQERAVAGLAGGIFDQPSLHHSRSSRSIGGNDYADTLRMKRQGGAEAEAVVTTAEVVAKEAGGGVVKAAEVAVKEGEAVAKEGEAVAKAAGKKAKSGKPWGMLAGAAVAGGLIDHTFFSGGHESPPAASASKPATPPSNPETPPSNSATPASDPATATYPPPGSGSATPAPKYTYNGPTYAYYGPGSYPPASYPPASYPPASKKRDVVDTPSVGRFGALDLLGEA
ncbi:hypothetical protein A4X06_0g9353 [Tilletia controversa]|uniref:Uncharacterized protein n=3 Tax=Tilletia TaxID=13289 RepID=A0A8X7MIM1_9BASI|nr:hypothetical protein A4X06_0g9353 [Tilletia controversa]